MIADSLLVAKRHLLKWASNPFVVVIIAIQGVFWLGLFGNSFNPANALGGQNGGGSLGVLKSTFGGAPNYITFLTPGILGVLAVTGMSFLGSDLVLDRMNGTLNLMRTYPISRTSIYGGAVLQNFVKGTVQVPVTILIAVLVPNGLRFAPGFGAMNALALILAIELLALVFSTLFTAIAIASRNTSNFFGVVNFLTFPIMFTSSALFPLSFFPSWLKPAAGANPLSLASDAARLALVHGTLSASEWNVFANDIVGLLVWGIVFTVLGTLMAQNALRAK